MNKDKIALLLGTRYRPHNIHRFCDSVYRNAQSPSSVEIIFYVDNDDPGSVMTLDEIGTYYENVRYVVGPRIVMNQMANECLKTTDASILAYFGDDFTFNTELWDKRIREEFDKIPDKIGLVWGDDLYNHETATHGFLHRNWVDTLGYVTPPEYNADYGDTYLTDIAKRINRSFFIPDLVFEHHHWSIKDGDGKPKSELDITYDEKNRRGYSMGIPCHIQYENDVKLREQEAEKLLQKIKQYEAVS